ncbi:hypothetical protein ES703_14001 [subsurface metagenome]
MEVEDRGVLGDGGEGEAVFVRQPAEVGEAREEVPEEHGVVAVLADGVGEPGDVEAAVQEYQGFQAFVQGLPGCLCRRVVLGDDAGVPRDEPPVSVVVGVLDVDLDRLG